MTGEDYEAAKDEHRPDWPGYTQHDALCPWLLEAGLPDRTGLAQAAACRCSLIARVREDEAAKREADGPWFRSVVHECCERVQTERAAALRDAKAAVMALPAKDQHDDDGFISLCFDKGEAIAAIEALGND